MARTLVIIDYGSGNLRSAQKALARVADESGADVDIVVTGDAERLRNADRIVLPGVGAFADCVEGLTAVPGMVEALTDAAMHRGVPFLGICVGMQLLASVGREFGDHDGLGWIEGEVVRLAPCGASLKIPHMGWNDLHIVAPHALLAGIDDGANVYFVHSFEFKTRDSKDIVATADYGGPFAALVARNNIAGVQFHPEKSQAVGLRLLANFLAWSP
ncbi:MAG: imidazole glycerol phosphate synthase subunit HisH [Rhizomicrobium sp.]|jgi:glutamine amidotransferase